MVPDLIINIKKLHPGATMPVYKTAGAACFDITITEDITIEHMEIGFAVTGLAMEIPDGYEVQLRPRSSVGKIKVLIANSPGTIDSDYRGEVVVELLNLSGAPVTFTKGQRVCQGKVAPVIRAEFEVVAELSETERDSGKFGSTGTH